MIIPQLKELLFAFPSLVCADWQCFREGTQNLHSPLSKSFIQWQQPRCAWRGAVSAHYFALLNAQVKSICYDDSWWSYSLSQWKPFHWFLMMVDWWISLFNSRLSPEQWQLLHWPSRYKTHKQLCLDQKCFVTLTILSLHVEELISIHFNNAFLLVVFNLQWKLKTGFLHRQRSLTMSRVQ